MPRAHRSLIILTVMTILTTGLASQALSGPAGTASDIQLGASLLLLITSTILLVRVLRYLYSPTRHQHPPAPRRSGPSLRQS